jgi:hypothetical protein
MYFHHILWKRLLLLGACIFFCILGFSQSRNLEMIPTASAVFTSSETILSWSIGENGIETFTNCDLVLTQGFHQPSLKITQIDEPNSVDLQLTVYPNPIKDFLTISIQSPDEISCTAGLYALSGKLLKNKEIKGKTILEKMDLSTYPPNLYILKIVGRNGQFLQTYKVQKIQ